ncbi:hypothetical protein M407DRAFT_20127 [Tulasnella calospora MUT 4182]|uniref:Uncharacterized protein n=1 Tax=Tulasnella calospora MUT 4182 TaxID=1051891 RepID=A0A0C3QQK1_9AGAM|nr:hypothetical protein M407DRAFT_20127 [Tulasnella calospora MUT 4182]
MFKTRKLPVLSDPSTSVPVSPSEDPPADSLPQARIPFLTHSLPMKLPLFLLFVCATVTTILARSLEYRSNLAQRKPKPLSDAVRRVVTRFAAMTRTLRRTPEPFEDALELLGHFSRDQQHTRPQLGYQFDVHCDIGYLIYYVNSDSGSLR